MEYSTPKQDPEDNNLVVQMCIACALFVVIYVVYRIICHY